MNKNNKEIKKSIYGASIIISTGVFSISTIINILIKAESIITISSLILTIILLLSLFIYFKKDLYNISKFIAFGSLLLFMPIFWKYDGGIRETVTFYFLGYITLTTILLDKWVKTILITISFLTLMVFFMLELHYPEIANSGDSYRALSNNVFGAMTLGLFTVFLLSSLLSSHSKIKRELELYNKELSKVNKKLEYLSRKDSLTGLSNRRDIFEKIESEIERARRNSEPFSLILGDIDNFKKINDTYGHKCGDIVLKRISAIMQFVLRKYDIAARWGGEEFLILLPKTRLKEATIIAERLRENIIQNPAFCEQKEIYYTITLGVVEYTDSSLDIEDYIKMADIALYKGKNMGKNCVVAYHKEEKETFLKGI